MAWSLFYRRHPFAIVPYLFVAYFLITTAPPVPSRRWVGAALLVACAAIELGIHWRHVRERQIAAQLAVEALLAVTLWVLWPASNGWILLIGVVGSVGGLLSHRIAIGDLALVTLAFVVGAAVVSGGIRRVPFDMLWLLLLLYTLFVIGVQRRGQREHLRRMEEMVVSLREYSEQLEEAQRQLRAEALQAAALAAAEERNRIAREIHDVLAHSLTVIVVQAQAIQRLVRTDPDAAEAQAATLAALARDGLTEARRSVSALRAPPEGTDGLATLRTLVEGFGSQTNTATSFAARGTERDLSPNAWTTLYRVTQEALTNARRHGQARRVDVRLAFDEPVRLTIEDDGDAGVAPDLTAGNGLRGMRERAERLGGRVSYGLRPEGGFRVELELPT